MPDISIITSTLNASAHIRKCIESIACQRGVDVQHLIIDGGSSDNTIEIAFESGTQVHLLRGSSIYEALNYGVTKAQAKYIGFLNSDDFYHSALVLKHVVNSLNSMQSPGIVYGNCRFVDSNGVELYRLLPAEKISLSTAKLRYFNISHPTWFIDREVFHTMGDYDTHLRYVSDCDFILRALSMKCEFKYLNMDLASFTLHSSNASTSMQAIAEKNESFVKWNGNSRVKLFLNFALMALMYSRDPRYFRFWIKRYIERL